MGAVEKREGGRASPDRVKILSMAYKGVVQPAIFRDSMEKKEEEEEEVCVCVCVCVCDGIYEVVCVFFLL